MMIFEWGEEVDHVRERAAVREMVEGVLQDVGIPPEPLRPAAPAAPPAAKPTRFTDQVRALQPPYHDPLSKPSGEQRGD